MTALPHHPLAELFPMMPDQEIREMADDICTFGQRVPIVLLDGQVLDGRNRQAACIFAEIEPEFIDYDGDDPLNFVLSHNLHRRHLTDSQRAMVAARIVDWETGMNQHSGDAHMPAHRAAERLSISERAVKAARRIHQHGTAELVQSIRDGRLSVRSGEALSHLEDQAQREALRLEEKQIIARAKEIRAGRQKLRHTVRLGHMEIVTERGQATSPRKLDRTYPVYYADPPWRFGVRSEVTGREKSAENHYPTMTTDEICALLAELIGPSTGSGAKAPPAVLFLWATNPMLLDALRVMAACGFTYVHHWIWDKEVAGTGYWGRDRHELLLIGRRGDVAAPLPGTQPETVYREKKGRHSAKPDYFAETIERLFPGVGRLELFARSSRPGWDAWGFEALTDAPAPQPDHYDEAVALVRETANASTSFVQRKLGLGWNAAAALMERMERDGIVSPPNSAGKRAVVVPADVDPKLIETVAKGMQTDIGRKALVTALDAMIEAEEVPKRKRGRPSKKVAG